MENQSHKEVDENLPLLENAKRSNAVAALAMKERPRVDAKSFKAPAPPLRERNCKREDWKRGTPPNPVKVPPKSPLTYTERYMSPTDALVSPVTRGLLARNRRPMRIVNPWGPPKALENTFKVTEQEVEPLPPAAMSVL
jgi:hypothetical protein